MKKEELIKLFEEEYGKGGEILCFFSPGRVNLIGEHTDYNGGYVFPGALSLGIYGALRFNDKNIITLKSKNAEGEVKVNLNEEIVYDEKDGWGNYPKGVIKAVIEKGYKVKGCDILFKGDLPDGAGLSSSAAIEVLTGYMMMYDGKDDIDRVELAKMCQKVENEFVKVNCGIMDQFSVAAGKKDMAILLDCNTLKYDYVPFNLKDLSLIIMNTNKKRGLAGSKYNERRGECEKAIEIIRKHKNVNSLCEAEIKDIEYIEDDVIKRRARHAITENERTLKAVEVLKKNDLKEFGQLMIKSHESLKNDYEVTGFELDTIVEEALKCDGCIGARMTGAGFGGCAIALVENDKINEFKEKVYKNYKEKTGLSPEFYVSVIGDGVKILN